MPPLTFLLNAIAVHAGKLPSISTSTPGTSHEHTSSHQHQHQGICFGCSAVTSVRTAAASHPTLASSHHARDDPGMPWMPMSSHNLLCNVGEPSGQYLPVLVPVKDKNGSISNIHVHFHVRDGSIGFAYLVDCHLVLFDGKTYVRLPESVLTTSQASWLQRWYDSLMSKMRPLAQGNDWVLKSVFTFSAWRMLWRGRNQPAKLWHYCNVFFFKRESESRSATGEELEVLICSDNEDEEARTSRSAAVSGSRGIAFGT